MWKISLLFDYFWLVSDVLVLNFGINRASAMLQQQQYGCIYFWTKKRFKPFEIFFGLKSKVSPRTTKSIS